MSDSASGTSETNCTGPSSVTVTVTTTQTVSDLETLVKGLNALSTPFQNLVVGGALIETGAALVTIGTGFAIVTCVDTGGLACGAAVWGGAHAVAGGTFLLYTGYQYTRWVTIPSFIELYRAVVPRH